MTWAQRVRRVFNIDIETCARCGGTLKGIVINRIPEHSWQVAERLNHSGKAARSERRIGERRTE